MANKYTFHLLYFQQIFVRYIDQILRCHSTPEAKISSNTRINNIINKIFNIYYHSLINSLLDSFDANSNRKLIQFNQNIKHNNMTIEHSSNCEQFNSIDTRNGKIEKKEKICNKMWNKKLKFD